MWVFINFYINFFIKDFNDAFDNMIRRRIIDKLELTGVRELALELLKNYLKDRLQYVKVSS